ncbi:MAG: arginine deiminase family protein [Bacteroidota bacterium]
MLPSPPTIQPSITSETDLLAQVLVHTPGAEMEMVSPEQRLDLLFDDILYIDHAQDEHQLMCAVFEKVVGQAGGVLQVSTLLHEAFEADEARAAFVTRLCQLMPAYNFQAFEADLLKLSPAELHRFALTGHSPLAIHAPPLPNLMFTRDVCAVVHDRLILSHAATAARSRESIIMDVVLHHHEAFAAHRDHVVRLPRGVTFEGGDLLVVNPTTVLIGHSERTSFSGVMNIATALFADTPIEHVLMVDIPKERSYMHLDTIFTFVSPTECTVFPPLIDQRERGNVVHFQPGEVSGPLRCEIKPSLKRALEEALGHPLTFIPCGGPDALNQRREQWTDGANFFALAPGVVIGYERNTRTFDAMREHGYRIVSAAGFLQYHAESRFTPGEKTAIKLEGTELSRGRGGPRCMTMPLARTASSP